MAESRFPSYLLEKSTAEKLDYFRAYTIAHPILKVVFNRLRQAIREPAGTSLIFIYGPPGVGKTTVRLRLEKEIKDEFLSNANPDPGRIPIVGIEAAASDSGTFSWKDYYKRTLLALEEPLIDYKLNYGVRRVIRNTEGKFYIEQRANGSELRYALENALKYRKVFAVLIDEAQHFCKIASGRKLQDQLDALKSLANLSGVTHVLLGTYELLDARNLSGQLSRRSVGVHFRRYRADSKEDIINFQNVIFLFQRNLPLEKEPDLVKHWAYLYERSLGCIGNLKDWLVRSLSLALEENNTTLTLEHLQQQAISIAQCSKMALEIEEGEKELAENAEQYNKLLSFLGLNKSRNQSKESFNNLQAPKDIKSRMVGRPNPRRNKVGK